MLLCAQNLTCTRNNNEILANVSLTLDNTQIISLYGPNGSGKTTLLKTLANILTYSKGVIIKNTKDICFLGHTNCLKMDLTVIENLLFWNGIYDGKTINTTVSLLKLENIINIPVRQLSAGQKRKVGIARLLISKSDVWLLDEPYSALDQENITLFNEIMESHLKENGGIIMSSHSPTDFKNAIPLNVSEFEVRNNLENDPFVKDFEK